MKKILSIFLTLLPILCWSDDFNGWKKLSTEHYLFIFEENDNNTAFELAGYSEEIYKKVTEFFNYYPDQIPVYINSRIDSPNGMFYPIPGSINVYPVYPLNSENSTKGSSWLYELLLHEMVHYVQLQTRKGFFGVLSYPFGKDLAAANGAFLPAWMIEGIAVYLESTMTDGGRGKNQYFNAINKASAIEENYKNIYQLAYTSDLPPYNRIYSSGYALTKYLIDHYGEEIFQKIYLRYIKFPFFGPFFAIKKETGLNLREIYEDFKESEIKKYAPEKKLLSIYPSSKISRNSFSNWTHPVQTEKGILLYRTDLNNNSAIVLLDNKNKDEIIIAETTLMDNSSFNADSSGEKIIFASGEYGLYHTYGISLNSNLYLFENKTTRQISKNQSLFQPAISVDGDYIIAVKRVGSYSKLVSVDQLSGETTDLFIKEQTNIMNPQFSPDSTKIAFVVNDHGYQDIYTMDFNNPQSARPIFSPDRYSEYFPRFISDETISFISDRDGALSLFTFDLESHRMSLIFKDTVGVSDGFIEGDNIHYSTYRTMGYEYRIGTIGDSKPYPIEESGDSPSPVTIGDFETKKYIDWTFPYLWLPKPYVQVSAQEGTAWGFGATVFAGSYGQSGQWILDLNFLPGPGQLNGTFNYSQKLGSSGLMYHLGQNYSEYYNGSDYFWRQKTNQTVQLTWPFYEKSWLNRRNVFSAILSLKHNLFVDSDQSFSFPDSFSDNSSNYLYTGFGLSQNTYNINYPAKALFGGFATFNQLDLSVRLPVFSSTKTSYVIKESGKIAFPLGPEGFLLKTGWKAAYHNRGLSSAAVNARGLSPALVSSDISLYYSLDYLMPIALVDWGLPLGFNIQNIAAAVHFEGISNVQFEGPESSELYGGLELIGTYGYNYGSIPAGAGINFRFFNKGETFNPSEDIKVYFFLSFNSLY